MNEVEKRKSRFVYRKLAPLVVSATDGDVGGLTYEVSRGEEYVRVNYVNGHVRTVCVTGDSHVALARDVLRVL